MSTRIILVSIKNSDGVVVGEVKSSGIQDGVIISSSQEVQIITNTSHSDDTSKDAVVVDTTRVIPSTRRDFIDIGSNDNPFNKIYFLSHS